MRRLIENKLIEVIEKFEIVERRIKEAEGDMEKIALKAAGYEFIKDFLLRKENEDEKDNF
jgi:hypothetical protein